MQSDPKVQAVKNLEIINECTFAMAKLALKQGNYAEAAKHCADFAVNTSRIKRLSA